MAKQNSTAISTLQESKYDVILKAPGSRKIEVIKLIRDLLPGVDLKTAKALAEKQDSCIKIGISEDEARKIARSFEDQEAIVAIQKHVDSGKEATLDLAEQTAAPAPAEPEKPENDSGRRKALDSLIAERLANISSHLGDLSDLLYENQDKFDEDCIISGVASLLSGFSIQLNDIASGMKGGSVNEQ